MNNTRNLLLMTIIAATLVLGTNVIPMQSFADRGDSDDRKKDNDYKSKTSTSYESDKKSSSQHQDQDNFCYRGDDCEQANQGQQMAGKHNEAKGFNDQSDNLAISVLAAGNGTTPTPIPTTCEECFSSVFTPAEIAAIQTNSETIQDICGAFVNQGVNAAIFVENLVSIGISSEDALEFIECLRSIGFTINP